jgi:hypothetical protein
LFAGGCRGARDLVEADGLLLITRGEQKENWRQAEATMMQTQVGQPILACPPHPK